MTPRTTLDSWIAEETHGGDRLDPALLHAFQRRALNETIAWALERSPFYRERLEPGCRIGIDALDDIARLPLMDDHDIRNHGQRMLCVSQGEVERVVTLRTSGSTAEPKRLYFTAEDLEHTRNFFAVGMAQLVAAGDTVLLLMPGSTPHSVGDLLRSALARLGAGCISYGFMDAPAAVADRIAAEGVGVLVGLPGQVLTLAREQGHTLRSRMKAVLLSGEHAPLWLTKDIAERLDCEVFVHYGLTETGLGGGVECHAHHGLHLREADLYVEIVDRDSQTPLPLGESGEIVLTTLRRRGMPLIRYATGDLGVLMGRECPCGSRVQRLVPLGERTDEGVALHEMRVSMRHVDEAVFRATGVSACYAMVLNSSGDAPDTLSLTLAASGDQSPNALMALEAEVRDTLLGSPDFGPLLHAHALRITITWATAGQCLAMSGPKRMLGIHNHQGA